MTKNEFKQGDKVYMAYDPTRSAVVTDVCDEGKYDYYVKEDGSDFTQGCYEGELLDAKTAFLTELQALLNKHDANINVWSGEDGDRSLFFKLKDGVEISYTHAWGEEQFDFPITTDNIMDFDDE